MLRNYIVVALRNLIRHRFYSLITIVGLSIGFACVTMIFLYVQDELSFESHHVKHSRIYRVMREMRSGDDRFVSYRTSGRLAEALAADHPEIVQSVRTYCTPICAQKTTACTGFEHASPIPLSLIFLRSSLPEVIERLPWRSRAAPC